MRDKYDIRSSDPVLRFMYKHPFACMIICLICCSLIIGSNITSLYLDLASSEPVTRFMLTFDISTFIFDIILWPWILRGAFKAL